MIEMKYSGTGFGTKELNAEQKPGLSFLGHFGISPTGLVAVATIVIYFALKNKKE